MNASQFFMENFVYHNNQYYHFNGICWVIVDIITIKKFGIDNHYPLSLLRSCDNKFNPDLNHLICFTNGVYDFKMHQFRKSLASDCCTLCTDYAYNPTYDNGMWLYLKKVFPEQKHYMYFMQMMDLLFRGHDLIINGQGLGNNGITTLYCLINTMYGDYGKIIDIDNILNRSIYTSDTGLTYLRNNFKGRYLMAQPPNEHSDVSIRCKLVNEFTSLIISHVDLKNTPLHFKSTFQDNFAYGYNKNDIYRFISDRDLIDKLPSFALTLMTKLIALQEEPIKCLYFYNNLIFVQDVNQYILDIYKTVIYL